MVVGELPESVDFLVIGGGPGGYVAALSAAALGRKVVVVDTLGEAGLGGVCVNVGCIPSKALIELADATHDLKSWETRGLLATGQVNMADFQTWKTQVVTGLNGGVRQLFKAAGITVIQGFFRFTRKDQGAVEFGDEHPPMHLKFSSCVVATGSRPATVAALPRDGIRILDSTDVLNLATVPAATVIVGGGYIGLELGTALAKVGSKVTIVEAASRILPQLPSHIVAPVTKRLAELGVTVLTDTNVIADDGSRVTVSAEGSQSSIAADVVVVCVGRRANTEDLGLEVLGVKTNEQGLLDVGADLKITPNVAAIGDITTGPALAHKASTQGHIAAEILSGHSASYAPMAIPAVIFSDPEIAMTGLTAEQATEQGLRVSTAMFPMAASGRARTMNESAGLSQLVHTDSGVIVGAQLVGPHVSEFIAEITLAIE
ncbi:MAG: dihydrolipoyl dehydrogenase, partial [Actinobacteria bacterium]|nr:dihydrolipoyl dehydrogenase [Actinomycetota bacterium]